MRIKDTNIDDVFKSKPCNIDTMQLKGYDLITELFADSSGIGQDWEIALTSEQLKEKLRLLIFQHGTIYTGITGTGMFQVYIGVFKKVRKSALSYISTNVSKRMENGNIIIRLWDTDILKINDYEHTAQLFNGGYQTRTTAKWINKFIEDFMVYQKNFKWFIKNLETGATIPFEEGMVIKLKGKL